MIQDTIPALIWATPIPHPQFMAPDHQAYTYIALDAYRWSSA